MSHSRISKRKKRNPLGRVKRQRLKYITILPSLITLINGVCGFAAIGLASKGVASFPFHHLALSSFAWSGYLIFIAMVADMLDGRVARMSHTTSSFGGQLDSLCDMISFGVAPAFLAMKVLEYKLAQANLDSFLADFLGRFIWLAAAVYVACAAIRLARFNVENEEDEACHMSFIGLPTPAAAGVLTSLVVFYMDMLPEFGLESLIFSIGEKIVLYSLPLLSIGAAILMVSRIRYPHLANLYLRGRKPMTHLFWSVTILGLIFVGDLLQGALVLTFCGFASSGLIRWVFKVLLSKTSSRKSSPAPVLNIANPADSSD
jgi:CDP-diacylglycerol--serine O-phosphatidyltransferase